MTDYYMLDTRNQTYYTTSNGQRAIVSEKTKWAYERMYAGFDNSPLQHIRFELIEERVHAEA